MGAALQSLWSLDYDKFVLTSSGALRYKLKVDFYVHVICIMICDMYEYL